MKKIQELTVKEILSLGIILERSNYLSLVTFSQFFEGNDELDIAFRFKELAYEELEHEAHLQRMYVDMFGVSTPDPLNFDFDDPEREILSSVFKGHHPDYFEKARKVFELALIGENRAGGYYQTAAETVSHKNLRLLFNHLALAKKNNSFWLEDQISKNKKNLDNLCPRREPFVDNSRKWGADPIEPQN